MEPITQSFFHRLSQLILGGPESEVNRTYLVLDELREAGRLQGFSSLLNQGRSKGCSIVIGLQDYEGAIESFGGVHAADEVMGLCASKTFLGTRSQKTASWIEGHMGQVEYIEPQYSTSESSGSSPSSSESVSYTKVLRSAVLASQMLALPPTNRANGLAALHDIPLVGSYWTQTPPQWLDENLIAPDPGTPAEMPRPESEERLEFWNEEDLLRLGLGVEFLGPIRTEQEKAETDLFSIRRDET
jgi:Type IV secretory pathway, VirD4 components